jgi:molybdopterin converting factor subunit 1
MKVCVKLFAAARDLAGQAELTLELEPGSAVRDVRQALVEREPALAALAARSLVAINAEYANDATPVAADDEIALIPPVSGG